MEKINFILNHKKISLTINPTTRLLDVIRNELHLTGTKEGCGEGACGACTVLVNGECYNSCLTPIANVIDKEVITIEEFSKTKAFQLIKEGFEEYGASQCGFCTPGMVLSVFSLLSKNNNPSEEEIRHSLSGNICRCTGYNAIVNAVLHIKEKGRGFEWKI